MPGDARTASIKAKLYAPATKVKPVPTEKGLGGTFTPGGFVPNKPKITAPTDQAPYRHGRSPAQTAVRSLGASGDVHVVVPPPTHDDAMRHAQTMAMQRELVAHGYHIKVDGIIGPETTKAYGDYFSKVAATGRQGHALDASQHAGYLRMPTAAEMEAERKAAAKAYIEQHAARAAARPVASQDQRFTPHFAGEPVAGQVGRLRNPDGSIVAPGTRPQPGARPTVVDYYTDANTQAVHRGPSADLYSLEFPQQTQEDVKSAGNPLLAGAASAARGVVSLVPGSALVMQAADTGHVSPSATASDVVNAATWLIGAGEVKAVGRVVSGAETITHAITAARAAKAAGRLVASPAIETQASRDFYNSLIQAGIPVKQAEDTLAIADYSAHIIAAEHGITPEEAMGRVIATAKHVSADPTKAEVGGMLAQGAKAEVHNVEQTPEAYLNHAATLERASKNMPRNAALRAAAPDHAKTPKGLHALLTELQGRAIEAADYRKWYEQSAKGILAYVGGDKAEADKLAALVAIYSPRAEVYSNNEWNNLDRAINAYNDFKRDEKISPRWSISSHKAGEGDWQTHRAEQVMRGNFAWDGLKTNRFYRNFLQFIDPEKYTAMFGAEKFTTQDTWMRRAFKYAVTTKVRASGKAVKEEPITPKMYAFMDKVTKVVADSLGWTPDEAQAAIWTSIKSEAEGTPISEAGFDFNDAFAHREARNAAVTPYDKFLHRIHTTFGGDASPNEILTAGNRKSAEQALKEMYPDMPKAHKDFVDNLAYQHSLVHSAGDPETLFQEDPLVRGIAAANGIEVPESKVARAVEDARENGGATLNPDLTPHEGAGYAVSIPGPERQIPASEFDTVALRQFSKDFKDVLSKSGHKLGIWHNPEDGKYYLDVSRVYASKEEALAHGRRDGQLAIFDLHNFEDIATGVSKDEHDSVLAQAVGGVEGRNLRGLPEGRSASADAQRIAREYAEKAGIPHNPPTDYARINPERAKKIAAWYDKAEHAPNDPKVRAAYDAMARETLAQYNEIVANGYRFEFYPKGEDPYVTPSEAIKDLRENKHMYVFPTEGGFGTEAVTTEHPLLADSGVRWGDEKVTHNDIFRAVHDFFGHNKEGVGFRAAGEENAWRSHSAMYSDAARPAMTAETRGQNSWVNYGPHGEANKTADQASTVYADQKAVLAPDWAVRDGVGEGTVKGAARVRPGRGAELFTFNKADVSTGLHEFFHALEQHLPAEAKAAIRDPEHGARSFEQYIANGVAPTRELVPVFDRLSAPVRKVYGGARVPGADLTPALRVAFDAFFKGSTHHYADLETLARRIAAGASFHLQEGAPDSTRLEAGAYMVQHNSMSVEDAAKMVGLDEAALKAHLDSEAARAADARIHSNADVGAGPAETTEDAKTILDRAQGVGPSHWSEDAVRLADEHGIDIADVHGTGEGGRVTQDDVRQHIFDNLSPRDQLASTFRSLQRSRREQDAGYSQERGKRFGEGQSIYDDGSMSATEKHEAVGAAMSGELPKVIVGGRARTMTADALDSLINEVQQHPMMSVPQKYTISDALFKLIGEGRTPTPREIELMQNIWGKDTVTSLQAIQSNWAKWRNHLLSIINIPRSIMSSLDASFGMRQGLVAGLYDPKTWADAWVDQWKYASKWTGGGEETYQALMRNVHAAPNFPLYKRMGLAITDLEHELGLREEGFQSNLAEQMTIKGHGPGNLIRGSGRMYTGMAIKLRTELADRLLSEAHQNGRNIMEDDKLLKELGHFINAITGRGDLPGKVLQESAPLLNSLFFSPRLLASRLQMLNPVNYLKGDKFVRQQYVKAGLRTYGTLSLVLGAIALFVPQVQVGLDWRSSDFGKIKFSNGTRIDLGGGFNQIIHLIGMLYSGQKISSSSGEVQKLGGGKFGAATRYDAFMNFLGGKLAPVPSAIHDWSQDKNSIHFGETFKLSDALKARLLPLSVQDTHDLLNNPVHGMPGWLAAIAGYGVTASGVGMQTYGPTVPGKQHLDKYAKLAKEVGVTIPPKIQTNMANAAALRSLSASVTDKGDLFSKYLDFYKKTTGKNDLERFRKVTNEAGMSKIESAIRARLTAGASRYERAIDARAARRSK